VNRETALDRMGVRTSIQLAGRAVRSIMNDDLHPAPSKSEGRRQPRRAAFGGAASDKSLQAKIRSAIRAPRS
jgi:hypothetical protein